MKGARAAERQMNGGMSGLCFASGPVFAPHGSGDRNLSALTAVLFNRGTVAWPSGRLALENPVTPAMVGFTGNLKPDIPCRAGERSLRSLTRQPYTSMFPLRLYFSNACLRVFKIGGSASVR